MGYMITLVTPYLGFTFQVQHINSNSLTQGWIIGATTVNFCQHLLIGSFNLPDFFLIFLTFIWDQFGPNLASLMTSFKNVGKSTKHFS